MAQVKEVKGPGPRRMGGPKPKVENPGKLLKRIMDEVFKHYLPHCILVLICIIVSALANVQASLFLKTLIDDYIVPMTKQATPDFGPLAGALVRIGCIYAIGVLAAWLLSSAIFGIVHVHPTVVVNAFVMGLVLAFIYLRTDSLWSAIILHAVNNGIAYLALIAGHGNSMLIDMVGSRTLYVLLYIAALAVFAVSGYMMLVSLRRLKAEEKNRGAA